MYPPIGQRSIIVCTLAEGRCIGFVSKEQHNERATNRKQFQKSDMNIVELTLLDVIRS